MSGSLSFRFLCQMVLWSLHVDALHQLVLSFHEILIVLTHTPSRQLIKAVDFNNAPEVEELIKSGFDKEAADDVRCDLLLYSLMLLYLPRVVVLVFDEVFQQYQ